MVEVNKVKSTLPNYEREMKGVDWGTLHRNYQRDNLDPKRLHKRIDKLMSYDDVTNKRGIYQFVLNGEERNLNIRSFTDAEKKTKFKQQGEKRANNKCPNTDKAFIIEDMEGDHITPWSESGTTSPGNLQMLCKDCNRSKGRK